MGAKTEFKRLPALFEERSKLIDYIRGLKDRVEKISESSVTKARSLREAFLAGKLTLDAFGKALEALDKNKLKQIEEVKKDLESTNERLGTHESEIVEIMGWIGRRVQERTPAVMKDKLAECDRQIKSLTEKLQAQKQPQAAIDANPQLLALKAKHKKYTDFTKAVMPKYASMAEQIRTYQALLHGR